MRFHALVACVALLGPLSCRQVSCSGNYGDTDLYMDEGSGDLDPSLHPHHDHDYHEGSGYRPMVGTSNRDGPYNAAYDTYEDTEDDDDDYGYEDVGDPYNTGTEGSGIGTIIIDDEDSVPGLGGEDRGRTPDVGIIEEIHVEKELGFESLPPSTRPPPTLTDKSDMEGAGTFQISSRADDQQVSIFAQPGILAAFIGGAVVGLLCAILLVMFIVYRMRKKDEGSYPLDEPKRMPLTSSYSPNDKEIYA